MEKRKYNESNEIKDFIKVNDYEKFYTELSPEEQTWLLSDKIRASATIPVFVDILYVFIH